MYIVITRWRHTLHILLNMSSVMGWDELHWYCTVKWMTCFLTWTVEVTCYHRTTDSDRLSRLCFDHYYCWKAMKIEYFLIMGCTEISWINSETLFMSGKVVVEQEIEITNSYSFQYLRLQYFSQCVMDWQVFLLLFLVMVAKSIHSPSVFFSGYRAACYRLHELDFDWG